MSIMNKIFGTSPKPAAPQQQQPAANPQEGGDQQQQPAQPNQQVLNPNQPKPRSPLDEFEELFKVKDNQEQQEDPNADYFSIDPDKLQEQVSKKDFLEGAEDFEELANNALRNGDAGALKSLLNGVIQRAYVEGTKTATQIANRTTKIGVDKTRQSLPKEMKSFLSESKTFQKDQRFSNPVLRPFVNAVRQQVEQQYPNATEEEIVDQTYKFMMAQAKYLTDSSNQQDSPDANRQRGPSDFTQRDFSDFFRN